MISSENLYDFAKESNEIEGVYDERSHLVHAAALEKFLKLPQIKIDDLEEFVKSLEPDHNLRTIDADRVWINGHEGTRGSLVRKELKALLDDCNASNEHANLRHQRYEIIHPFTDGNGRSGRALWLWQMNRLGYDGRYRFLQMYYYMTLEAAR